MGEDPLFNTLIENNKNLANKFYNSDLIKLIKSDAINNKNHIDSLLDAIQIFSNYFQKVLLLKSAFTNHIPFVDIASQHLKEELFHNEMLMQERNNRPLIWDPILEATSSWFAWKMLNSSDEEKIILVHLVLEASGNIFFKTAHPIMEQFGHQQYFHLHAEIDEQHEAIGYESLKGFNSKIYQRLVNLQQQGWDMVFAASKRMEVIATHKTLNQPITTNFA